MPRRKLSETLRVDWRPAQKTAALMLAIGATESHAAVRAGVSQSTITAWKHQPLFDERVRELRASAWQDVEQSIMANVQLALEVQRQGLAGELAIDDPRYRESARLIDRMLDRLLYVEPAGAPAGGPGTINAAVVINQPGSQHAAAEPA